MAEGELSGVRCFVCLDEGCEWCPAVDAFDDEPVAAERAADA